MNTIRSTPMKNVPDETRHGLADNFSDRKPTHASKPSFEITQELYNKLKTRERNPKMQLNGLKTQTLHTVKQVPAKHSAFEWQRCNPLRLASHR